ncbi:MAG: hypothetical protein ACOYJC_04080 [Christensenellales bacterium]|jgi:hypothetical protein
MFRVWGILKKNQKIVQDHVVESYASIRALDDCLEEICRVLDIAKPVILQKHEHDFNYYNRCVFKSGDFLEPFYFDSFEIENITPAE